MIEFNEKFKSVVYNNTKWNERKEKQIDGIKKTKFKPMMNECMAENFFLCLHPFCRNGIYCEEQCVWWWKSWKKKWKTKILTALMARKINKWTKKNDKSFIYLWWWSQHFIFFFFAQRFSLYTIQYICSEWMLGKRD